MPKCRSCTSHVGRNQTYCFICGVWCPDKGQLMTKIAGVALLVLVVIGIVFLTTREQAGNVEARILQHQIQ